MATTFTILPVADKFLPGKTVGAYPETNWPAHLRDAPTGAPLGAAADTSVVAADSTVPEFTGLTEGVRYRTASEISAGVWRYGPMFVVASSRGSGGRLTFGEFADGQVATWDAASGTFVGTTP